MRKLGKKPSTFLRQALDDLAEIERDPRYVVDMSTYHTQQYDGNGCDAKPTGVCEVCLAGAVMAKRLGADPKGSYGSKDFGGEFYGRMRALDAFRLGDIQGGLRHSDIDPSRPAAMKLPVQMPVPYYDADRRGFKRAMRKMVRMFQAVGLCAALLLMQPTAPAHAQLSFVSGMIVGSALSSSTNNTPGGDSSVLYRGVFPLDKQIDVMRVVIRCTGENVQAHVGTEFNTVRNKLGGDWDVLEIRKYQYLHNAQYFGLCFTLYPKGG